ncbi:MAG: hypothetical protein ACOYXC_16435 [Candidatus Rifleibacteriota bacterium]
MNNLINKRSICIALVLFVFALCGSMLQAASKHEMFEVGQKISELNQKITEAYEELRKLNEEGGPEAQEQAQVIMMQIKEMKEDVKTLKAVLDNMKNKVRN